MPFGLFESLSCVHSEAWIAPRDREGLEPIVNNLWITFCCLGGGLDSQCPTLCAILVPMKITRIKFKLFNKPHVLKKIGRDLLARFFERFKTELQGNGLALPPPELSDDEYFDALSRLLLSPESLPRCTERGALCN